MRKVVLFGGVVLVGVSLLASCSENAGSGPIGVDTPNAGSDIYARVKDAATGYPIENAHVVIYIWEEYGDWAYYDEGYTNSQGWYFFQYLPEGEYWKVVASKDGYGGDEDYCWVYEAPVYVYLYLNPL